MSRSVTESGGLVWGKPKTWDRRSVPFPAALADELAKVRAGVRSGEDLVFTDMRGGANVKAIQRMLGHTKASMILDVYADLFDDDLDDVAANPDAAMRTAGNPRETDQNSQTVGRDPKSP